jgi:hypothetical protein
VKLAAQKLYKNQVPFPATSVLELSVKGLIKRKNKRKPKKWRDDLKRKIEQVELCTPAMWWELLL